LLVVLTSPTSPPFPLGQNFGAFDNLRRYPGATRTTSLFLLSAGTCRGCGVSRSGG
jgi:hypothetical protein